MMQSKVRQLFKIFCNTYITYLLKHFLLPGFRYGSDIVPFSKVDQEQMKYKHDGKCFAVLGFTKQNQVLFSMLVLCMWCIDKTNLR